MFYLNEKLIQETPGAPDATYGETSKEIDAGWRARFHARCRFGARMALARQKKRDVFAPDQMNLNRLPAAGSYAACAENAGLWAQPCDNSRLAAAQPMAGARG
ncbi:hypothetical protein KIV45_24565 [Janthinobacterium lividum]|nr:hypothetical protein KIV45_24565 [Janthinobacterium lividum]